MQKRTFFAFTSKQMGHFMLSVTSEEMMSHVSMAKKSYRRGREGWFGDANNDFFCTWRKVIGLASPESCVRQRRKHNL